MAMDSWMKILLLAIGGGFVFCFLSFGFISIMERERRAARYAFLLAMGTGLLFSLSSLLGPRAVNIVLLVIGVAALLLLVLFLLSIGRVSRGFEPPEI